jgi:hypothetical protein
MKRMLTIFTVTAIITALLGVPPVLAQKTGPPPDFAKNAFHTILSGADKNGDGKLSMEECYSVWKDRVIAEKNCGHWDVNGDGIITEDEYVSKAMKASK